MSLGRLFYWGWINPSTHWGRVTHICVGKLTIIGSDNGLSPERRQAIIWTNAGILLIGPLGTNFSEILIETQTFSLKKIRLKMSSAKSCSFRLDLNVLKTGKVYVRNQHCGYCCLQPSVAIVLIKYSSYRTSFIPKYRKISNIKCTKFPNLNFSRFVLQLSLPKRMKPGVKSRMKM